MLQDASSWDHVMDHHVAFPDRQASGSGFAALPISAMLFFLITLLVSIELRAAVAQSSRSGMDHASSMLDYYYYLVRTTGST